jgi:hypothetical protein
MSVAGLCPWWVVESYIWVLLVYSVFVESIEFTNRQYVYVGGYLSVAHAHVAQYNKQ